MSEFLKAFKKYIVQKEYTVYSVAEATEQKEEEISIVPGNPCQNAYSVAKAFVVTAVGMLYDRGMVKPEDIAIKLMGADCPAYADKRWERISVHHLLTHSSGLPEGCLDIDSLDATEWGQDYLAYLMTLPLDFEPGEKWQYSDGAFYFLSRIVERLTGENLLAFMWKNFFYKTGSREAAWSSCPKGHCIGATGLYTYSIDFVRLGMLYLCDGMYKGERFLSKDWVDRAKAAPYEMYQAGIGSLYGKGGMRGQQMIIDPEKRRVVGWHGYENANIPDLLRFIHDWQDK